MDSGFRRPARIDEATLRVGAGIQYPETTWLRTVGIIEAVVILLTEIYRVVILRVCGTTLLLLAL